MLNFWAEPRPRLPVSISAEWEQGLQSIADGAPGTRGAPGGGEPGGGDHGSGDPESGEPGSGEPGDGRSGRDEPASATLGLAGGSLPTIPGLQISVRCTGFQPDRGGLGDFCDVFALPAGRWGVVVGAAWADRSAGRRPASKSVESAVTALRSAARSVSRPSAALAAVNRAARAAPPDRPLLLTATYATVLPTRAGTLVRVCTAGDQVVLLRRAGGAVITAGRTGVPVGLGQDQRLRDVRLLLRPGDSLLLATEAVTEALAGAGRSRNLPGWSQPGAERLREIVAGLAGATAARSADTILRAVRDAAGGRPDLPTIAVVIKVPRRRRGSGVHAGGWPGSRPRTVARRTPG